jgi:hypothetical protein
MRFKRFRKKPVVVHAWQFDPGDIDWIAKEGPELSKVLSWSLEDGYEIHSPEGRMRVLAGDWIIRGIEGEYYPCKDEIFRAKYEAVE